MLRLSVSSSDIVHSNREFQNIERDMKKTSACSIRRTSSKKRRRRWRRWKQPAECLRTKYYDNYEKFNKAIQQCLDDLPSKHKPAMDTLLTHKFQTFENVSLIAA